MGPARQVVRLAVVSLALSLAGAAYADADVGSKRFIPTLLVYYGGGPRLTPADATRLAKYDLIDLDRFRYNQIGGNTWDAIKRYNPDVEIYVYEMGAETPNYQDATPAVMLNGLGRYSVSRGHPMGSLNGDHPELYLLDPYGYRIYSRAFSNIYADRYWLLMDFGSATYQSYWVTAVKADIIDQPWVADGVFADNCLTFPVSGGYSGTPALYPTSTQWSNAMNRFASGIAAGLHGYGQKLWCNKGDTRSEDGVAAWKALDASADRPDVLMEEGAFAVEWGNSAVQFFPEAQWKSQVDVLAAVTNSKIALLSHTKLAPNQTAYDDWGKPVSFWQIFYYTIGSMLLGKSEANNAYLMFSTATNFNDIVWFDEYDAIDLGKPLAAYRLADPEGVNVYYREFERGYVVVNPTPTDVSWIPTPPVRPITHDNLYSPLTVVNIVTSIPLAAHSAAILRKTVSEPVSQGGE
jgi:hypothetical protein